MGFGAAIKSGFVKWRNFSGRATRSEFWFFYLFLVIGSLVARGMDAAFGIVTPPIKGDPVLSWGVFSLVFRIAMILPFAAVTVRRLHDTNHSGWWLLALLGAFVVAIFFMVVFIPRGALALVIPFLLGLLLLRWFIDKGAEGPNRYGPPRIPHPEPVEG